MTVSNPVGQTVESVNHAYASGDGVQMAMSVFALKKTQQADAAMVGRLLESLPVLRYSPGGQATTTAVPGQQLDLLA